MKRAPTDYLNERKDFAEPEELPIARAGHEFLIVLVIATAFGQLRLLLSRYFDNTWISDRLPRSWTFAGRELVHCAAINALTKHDLEGTRRALNDDRLIKRARRISLWSRGRRSSDAFDRYHAATRAARSLMGLMSIEQTRRFRDDANRQLTGVPNSEPTWTRLLDGTLAAIALNRLGEAHCVRRWTDILESRFALHGGRRASSLHTPTMMAIGTATPWEHAVATALAFREGWIDDRDWQVLRAPCLGAAAGGAKDPAKLRLVAAGRLWAALKGDEDALRILSRRRLDADSIATAIIGLAENGERANQIEPVSISV